jgi:hypothetical protein
MELKIECFGKYCNQNSDFKKALKKNARMLNDNRLEWTKNILKFSNRVSLNRTKSYS